LIDFSSGVDVRSRLGTEVRSRPEGPRLVVVLGRGQLAPPR